MEHTQVIQIKYVHQAHPHWEKWHAWFESGDEALKFEREKIAAGYLVEVITCAVVVKL